MIVQSSEFTYFCFPATNVVRRFQHYVASSIDSAGNFTPVPLGDLHAEGCRRFLTEKHGHGLDEQCGVWRYVFFMQFSRTVCVRQVRIGDGLVTVGEISEV